MCTALQARVALAEVVEVLESAEAKAYYGLAINWGPLNKLVEALLDQGVLQVLLAACWKTCTRCMHSSSQKP